MKRKHITFVVVLILFVFAAACGPEENIQESQTDKSEELEKAEGLEEIGFDKRPREQRVE